MVIDDFSLDFVDVYWMKLWLGCPNDRKDDRVGMEYALHNDVVVVATRSNGMNVEIILYIVRIWLLFKSLGVQYLPMPTLRCLLQLLLHRCTNKGIIERPPTKKDVTAAEISGYVEVTYLWERYQPNHVCCGTSRF